MGSVQLAGLENEIRTIVAEILEIDEEKITPNARFVEELGMDSMMALEILASMEKKYSIRIPEGYLTKVTTLKNMAEIVKKIMDEQ